MYPIDRHSQRLHLRELRPDDVDGMFAIYGDARATEHMSFDPRTRQDVEGIDTRSIASAAADPRQEYALAVADTDNDDGRLIGFGRLALDPTNPGPAFGFALNPDVWGNGYGTETVRLLLACAFEHLELHRVWGPRSPHNTASARTAPRRAHRGGLHPRTRPTRRPMERLHHPLHPGSRIRSHYLAMIGV
ncbi:GNAT family N-acetyltransferase [Streptomyces globisporus]|uniref:GNAT family N-acetyltransferase n=1 Tax=Streptomyces globisporus TaxID=1908 RepID=UPI003789FEF0